MSASQSHAIDATALQLAAALGTFDQSTREMIATWPDIEHYREVSRQVEQIRMYSAVLPETRVQWLELLIAHAELVHLLWRMQYGQDPAAADGIARVRERHADCLAALRKRCLRQLARPPARP